MKKIISLFKRDYERTRLVFDEITPGAEWVANGEGAPTVKVDGTCCMVRDGKLYKRHDVKKGKQAPEGFEPAQDPDPITGHWPGWLPVGDGPEDKYHREAHGARHNFPDCTCELIGPKIQGDPYGSPGHVLIQHGEMVLDPSTPRTFEGLRDWLYGNYVEGIVWHRENGDMVKIKRKDFGYSWPIKL